jgi:error-prone DNA polymerase
VARPAHARGGRQLALDLELGRTPSLPRQSAWDELVDDYATTGLSVRPHPLAQLRPALSAQGFTTTAELRELPSETPIRLAGLTVARQRPASAGGVVFLLVEDEHGMVNLVLFSAVYERVRLVARTEPLLEVHGRLERRERNLNVIVDDLLPLAQPGRPRLTRRPSRLVAPPGTASEAPVAAGVGALRAVAPGAHHFAQGRR